MAFPAKFRCPKPTLHLYRRSPRKISFPPFSIDFAKSKPVRLPVIRALSSPIPSLFKTTCITLTASAALCSASFFPISKPASTTLITISTEEATLEKQLETQARYMEELLSLTKIRYDSVKYDQALEILDRMIEIEPYEQKWSVMRARILSYHCDDDSAIKALKEILAKDPICFEAYHYLVLVYYHSKPKLQELEKRITKAIKRCKKEKKTKEIRDFRLLIAHIKVIEGYSDEAIRICKELVKKDPEYVRIYLFQGAVYTLLMKKEEEARKLFEETARMFPGFPDNHPNFESGTDSEWGAIVAYDEISCYLSTCARLMINTSFGKTGVHWFKSSGNQSFLKTTIMLVSGIQWLIRSSLVARSRIVSIAMLLHLVALGICEELVKEDPKIYLFQGFVYTLMHNDDESAKQFKELFRLLPEDHPYRAYATNQEFSGWSLFVAYDSVLCYSYTFSTIIIGTMLTAVAKLFRIWSANKASTSY